MMMRFLLGLFFGLGLALPLAAQNGPLRIEITEGVIEPMPIAVPNLMAETSQALEMSQEIARLIARDLVNTGLFREINQDAFISRFDDFTSPVAFADWRAINAQALVRGAVAVDGAGNLTVKFRLYDVFAGQELGDGLQLSGTTQSWRRVAHKVADAAYARLTGEGGYFDSRVVFVSETGPKASRQKRLAIMDYDGANISYLTAGDSIVLAPRFSPGGDRVLYTSYESGTPRIQMLTVSNVARTVLDNQAGAITFAPRFAPNGRSIVFSLTENGNTDIYMMDLTTGQRQRLTNDPSIETAPDFSPDGSRIVFESDRSGSQQLYIMSARGGEPQRISFGDGRYGTPVWSPRGDLVAFTKQGKGRFHIGVMRIDGSEERLLTASFLDEGPSWAPNGRVVMFSRETQGESGQSNLYSVDISGRNLQKIPTPGGGSDPSWGPLQN